MQADDAHSTQNAPSAIRHGSQPPGSTIGMVGGGQLGRMFAVAAAAIVAAAAHCEKYQKIYKLIYFNLQEKN